MIMKHFTQIKNLLVLAVACFCGQMTVNAQEVDEEPEVLATFNMVDHITSGKSYVIGIQTDQNWLAAEPPFAWYYPALGRVFCSKSFEPNDEMQILLGTNDYLPTFVFTEDESGTLIQYTGDGAYLSINIPESVDDDKDEKGDDKDDDKESSMEYVFLLDTIMSPNNYWNVSYNNESSSFVIKHKASNTTVGVDCEMFTSEIEGEVIVSYQWRLAPYVTVPEDLAQPIYLFELQETQSGVSSVDIDENVPMVVYNMNGVQVGSSLKNLPSGVYIVKQAKSVKKVLIK